MSSSTQVREPNFALDLPGDWAQAESTEPGNFVYCSASTGETVSVMLLAVRPVYALADSQRLVSDYMSHRGRFEKGQSPMLEPSESSSSREGETIEGRWDAVDLATGDRVRHRVILLGTLLGDFRYEAAGMEEAAFDERADALLGGASLLAD